MQEYLLAIKEWIVNTQVPEQIKAVDAAGLFHNPYFLTPFICLIIYYLYKQAINNLVILGLVTGLWYFSGTDYVRNAVVGDRIQLSHVLPIAGVGIFGIAVIIYLVFIRQD